MASVDDAHTRAGTGTGASGTRDALLEAGAVVAERDGLASLSVNRVVTEAGLAKGTFYVHFPDRDAFVSAVHERFYGRVDAAIAVAVGDLPPGPERLRLGTEAYLDACLVDRAMKALLLEARAQGASIDLRQAGFADLIEPDLRAMGWRDARPAARLLVAMTSEAALTELEAGRPVPAARRSLRRFMRAPGDAKGG